MLHVSCCAYTFTSVSPEPETIHAHPAKRALQKHAVSRASCCPFAPAALAYQSLMPIPPDAPEKVEASHLPGVAIEGKPLPTPEPLGLRLRPEAVSGVLMARALLGLGELDRVGGWWGKCVLLNAE